MRKVLLPIFLILFSINFLSAQEIETKDTLTNNGTTFKSRFFQSNGMAYFTDVDIPPLRNVSYTYHVNGSDINYSGKFYGYSFALLTYIHQFRYNIYEVNNDFSLSINSPLDVGFNMLFTLDQSLANATSTPTNTSTSTGATGNMGAGVGFFKLSIPLYLQVNYGGIATQKTEMEKGVTFGIGIEYQLNPLFMLNVDDAVKNVKFDRSYFIIPSMNVGYRYLNKNQHAKEVNLKIGMGSSSSFTANNGNQISQTPLNVMLSWNTYLSY